LKFACEFASFLHSPLGYFLSNMRDFESDDLAGRPIFGLRLTPHPEFLEFAPDPNEVEIDYPVDDNAFADMIEFLPLE
jgi:hypothetical protein